MKVAVVIINYRTAELVGNCLAALRESRRALPDLEAIVADGNSGDGSVETLRDLADGAQYCEWVTILPLSMNGGFGWANNQAILPLLQRPDPPDFIHLLNPDTIVAPGAVEGLADFLSQHPEAGAAGSQLLSPDGQPSVSAFSFPSVSGEFVRAAELSYANRILRVPEFGVVTHRGPFEAEWVTGASVMFRSAALRDAGLFDDGFFLYHEELELMWRMRLAGWTIWHVPASRVVHIEGAATKVGQRDEAAGRPALLPDYWYASRRRLFALRYGRLGAIAAAFAWTAGHLLWLLRSSWDPARRRQHPQGELAKHLRLAFQINSFDVIAAARAWDSPAGQPPAWMQAAKEVRR